MNRDRRTSAAPAIRLALTSALLALAACHSVSEWRTPGTGQACVADSSCGSDRMVCVRSGAAAEGQCAGAVGRSCTSNLDCADFCLSEDGRAEIGVCSSSCTSDDDCGSGRRCDTNQSRCFETCTTSNECDAALVCTRSVAAFDACWVSH